MQEKTPHAGGKPTAKHYPDVLSFTQLHLHGEVTVVFLARDVADAVMAAAGERLAAATGVQPPLVYTIADTSGSLSS